MPEVGWGGGVNDKAGWERTSTALVNLNATAVLVGVTSAAPAIAAAATDDELMSTATPTATAAAVTAAVGAPPTLPPGDRAALLGTIELLIMLLANPDGYAYTQVDRWWGKQPQAHRGRGVTRHRRVHRF